MISDNTTCRVQILFNDYIYTPDINYILNTHNINYHMYADDI